MGTPIKSLNGLQWTADDLIKKFQGSYVLASIETPDGVSKPKVIYIENPAGDNGRVIARIGKMHLTPYQKHFYVEDDRPPACCANVGDNDAVLFRYNPERQWRRGVGNYNCFFFWAPDFFMKGMGEGIYADAVAEAVFHPKKSTLAEALDAFKTNKSCIGRAIKTDRPDVDYTLVRYGTALQLYRGRALLGAFTGSRFFSMENAGKLFRKEIDLELPSLRKSYALK